MILTVDSFAWIEFLTRGPHGLRVRREIERAGYLLTPDVVLAEVARKFAKDGLAEDEIRTDLHLIAALSEVVPISEEIALRCSEADRQLRENAVRQGLDRPGFADAVILAAARTHSAGVLTGDPHFLALPDTVWIGG